MIAGQSPRVLTNENGKKPHEAIPILPAILNDRRWRKLRRLFTVGFQETMELRFQNCAEFRAQLLALEPDATPNDALEAELAKVEEIVNSTANKGRIATNLALQKATHNYVKYMDKLVKETNVELQFGGSYSHEDNFYEAWYGIRKEGVPGVFARIRHRVVYKDGQLIAAYAKDEPLKEYYRGSFADLDSLDEAIKRETRPILALMLSMFAQMLRN